MVTNYLILCGSVAAKALPLLSALSGLVRLHLCYQTADCLVFSAGSENILRLPSGDGVILGTVFPRYGDAAAITGVDRTVLEHIAHEPRERLVQRFWGSYLLCTRGEGEIAVSRDPSASMPCYFTVRPDGMALASDAALLVELGLATGAVAWEEMPRYLSVKDLPSATTGLDGIRELLAGTTLTLAREGTVTTEAFWSPWDHVAEQDQATPVEQAEVVARVIRQCCRAWRSTCENPLALVSGGLDSSVVVASIASDNQPLSCMTMATDDPVGDERDYARALAQAFNVDLFEAFYDLADISLNRSAAENLPKPVGRIHEVAMHEAVWRHAQAIGADAIFSGNGGDNIFYNSRSVRLIFDRMRSAGLSPAAFRTMADFARLTGADPIKIVFEMLKFTPVRDRPYRWPRDLDFLSPSVKRRAGALRVSHDWLARPTGATPGKIGQIALLLRMQNHVEGYLRSYGISLINPLVAQPILETLLHVPSWQMIEGGQDRAVIRRAFSDSLPTKILARRTKGSPSAFALMLLGRNGQEVRDRLLGGQLADRGYVDTQAIGDALDRGPGMGLGYTRLLSFLDVEAWLASWQDRVVRGGQGPFAAAWRY